MCVFRHPAATVESILKICENDAQMRALKMTAERAVKVWSSMYEHVLHKHFHSGDWLFTHFEQILTGDGLERLQSFLGCNVDRGFPEQKLAKSSASVGVPASALTLYRALCERAGFVDRSLA